MQGPKPKRITWGYIFESFLNIFNLEKGLLYTLQGLLLKPGQTIRVYLFEDREKLMKPFAFFILTSTLAVLIAINLDPLTSELAKGNISGTMGNKPFLESDSIPKSQLEENNDSTLLNERVGNSASSVQDSLNSIPSLDSLGIKEESEPSSAKEIDPNAIMGELYQKYFGKYAQALYWLLLPVIALLSYLFFGKQKWFYPEHFVLNTYLAGMQNLMYVILVPLLYVFGGNVIYGAYFICTIAYQIFAYRNLFTQYDKLSSTWRAFLCNVLSFVLFTIVFGLLLGIAVGIYMARQMNSSI